MAKPKRKTGSGSSKVRHLSSSESSYLEELKLFGKVVDVTAAISLNQHGIDTDGRGVRASRIYTRQTLTAISLHKLLPRPSPKKHQDSEFWDLGSIASLARNIVETYLSFHYFGIEKVSESEAELRFHILQLHRNVEWYQIRKLTDPNDPALKEFESGIASEKARIRAHAFIDSLTAAQRDKALRGHEMYETKADFERELSVCTGLRRDYRFLSNLIHPLPLSIERVDDVRGRGIGSDADVNMCILCVALARRYLAATSVGMVDFFVGKLSRFEEQIDEIRPMMHIETDVSAGGA